MHDSEEWPGEKECDVAVFIDPRCPQLGVRFLCAHGQFDLEDGDELNSIQRMSDTSEYTLYRHMLGVLESSHELGNQFPLNCHLHHLNGVSFDKGCYIGQELTQRTFHTGVLRRMALPFALCSKGYEPDKLNISAANFIPLSFVDRTFDMDLKGENIMASLFSKSGSDQEDDKMKLGKVMVNKHNLGIAMVDYQKMDEVGGNRVYWLDDYRVVLWQPLWLDIINQRRSFEDSDAAEPQVHEPAIEVEVKMGRKDELPDEHKK